jgi:hypothetical protein
MPDSTPAAETPRRRWVIPDDGIIDPIAVEIAARGERIVRLTLAERRAVAARILAEGGTAATIATRLCMPYTAARVLAASSAGPPVPRVMRDERQDPAARHHRCMPSDG